MSVASVDTLSLRVLLLRKESTRVEVSHPFSEIVHGPVWFSDAFPLPGDSTKSARSIAVEVNADIAKARAESFLATAPTAIEGQGGNQTTFAVICRLKEI